jgi:hypothetical protein
MYKMMIFIKILLERDEDQRDTAIFAGTMGEKGELLPTSMEKNKEEQQYACFLRPSSGVMT